MSRHFKFSDRLSKNIGGGALWNSHSYQHWICIVLNCDDSPKDWFVEIVEVILAFIVGSTYAWAFPWSAPWNTRRWRIWLVIVITALTSTIFTPSWGQHLFSSIPWQLASASFSFPGGFLAFSTTIPFASLLISLWIPRPILWILSSGKVVFNGASFASTALASLLIQVSPSLSQGHDTYTGFLSFFCMLALSAAVFISLAIIFLIFGRVSLFGVLIASFAIHEYLGNYYIYSWYIWKIWEKEENKEADYLFRYCFNMLSDILISDSIIIYWKLQKNKFKHVQYHRELWTTVESYYQASTRSLQEGRSWYTNPHL